MKRYAVNLVMIIAFLCDSVSNSAVNTDENLGFFGQRFLIEFLRKSSFATGTSRRLVKKRAAAGGTNKNEWSEFSCCRREIGIQTREKIVNNRFVKIEMRPCVWNYCTDCADDIEYCDQLRDLQRACDQNSTFVGLMSRHCPKACSWCEVRTTAKTPTTSSFAFDEDNLQRIYVFFDNSKPINSYKFTTDTEQLHSSPWKPASKSIFDGEVDSFLLFNNPTTNFTMKVTFCTSEKSKASIVTTGKCNGDWKQNIVLYASNISLPNTERLFVANRGRYPWSSRIFRGNKCCGYRDTMWSFYAPILSKQVVSSPELAELSPPPNTSTNPAVITSIPSVILGTDPKVEECLQYHNYFRSVHNVPPLQLDPELSATAKKWADYLAKHAPTYPFLTDLSVERTANWPHSDRGTKFRSNGVGENIAWDFSPEGSSPKESVLRWYTEIFHYDRKNPLENDAENPTGHYTQMIWKDSTHLGCGVAITQVRRGSFVYESTYTVAHYVPSGNVHFQERSRTVESYSKNVPVPNAGSCVSPENCLIGSAKSRCMGLSEKMSCQCIDDQNESFNIGSRPRCYGSGGCIVSCKKPLRYENSGHQFLWVNECMGEWSCECVLEPNFGKLGAYCT